MAQESASQDQHGIMVPIVRVGQENAPILFVNDFVIQFHDDAFFLTAGQLQPPMLFSSGEQRREEAGKLEYVPVRTVARFGFTRDQMVKLIAVLEDNLEKFDAQQSK